MAASNGTLRTRSKNDVTPPDADDSLREQLQSVRRTISASDSKLSHSLTSLLICAGGIYASFLTWGVLQERITTTNYGTTLAPKQYDCPVVLNTVQSILAALLGYVCLRLAPPKGRTSQDLAIFPTRQILWPMSLVAITSSLASPFGYASLQHVDYITFTLAKSCKLLPVMALHVTLFRRKYPLYKYAVVALVTTGVAVFTLHHPSSSSKRAKSSSSSSAWGLVLLSINLLFDGLTNSTQDHIYKKYKTYTGQQMMCALNVISTGLTVTYLLLTPYLTSSWTAPFLQTSTDGQSELSRAISFVTAHPSVGRDILAFAACGAMGQVFIFYTLATFGSLLLVTLTVTRKMLTMIVSVVWFGHTLSAMQWVGVGLVFFGIGVEAELSKREKKATRPPVDIPEKKSR